MVPAAVAELMQGRATPVLAKRPPTVQKADRIVVRDLGRIVAQGGHVELLRDNALYASLASMQLKPPAAPNLLARDDGNAVDIR